MKFLFSTAILSFTLFTTPAKAMTEAELTASDMIAILIDSKVRELTRESSIKSLQKEDGYYYLSSGTCMATITVERGNELFDSPDFYNPRVNVLAINCY